MMVAMLIAADGHLRFQLPTRMSVLPGGLGDHLTVAAGQRRGLGDDPNDRGLLMATAKTNAVRLLDRLGIRHEPRSYDVDPDDLAAETVAHKIGMPLEQVFKTLVARGDKHGVCLAVVPGNCELDLKALAKTTGDKKIETVPLKEVEPLTGYIRGGVTALACKKPYPVYLDETAELFDVISISAGMRGLQVLLAPDDYIRAVSAKLAPIAKGKQ
jgi:Cys-tRNA(Pro)/Cys-tRNA(Cys) deacylase